MKENDSKFSIFIMDFPIFLERKALKLSYLVKLYFLGSDFVITLEKIDKCTYSNTWNVTKRYIEIINLPHKKYNFNSFRWIFSLYFSQWINSKNIFL